MFVFEITFYFLCFCRVINRAPGLKLVVQTLLSSLRPIGNIVLICCTFFIIFGILGVQVGVKVLQNQFLTKKNDCNCNFVFQLFKGALYYCGK